MQYNKETKTLTIDYRFDEELKDIPEETEIIIFQENYDLCQYSNFNQKVNNLPKNLTHLTFGFYFNQKVDKLPKNLKYLKLGWRFQNEIILPKKLKELSLTCNNNLINNLPDYIEKIYIYFNDYYIIKAVNLPPTLREIIIEDEYYKKYIKIPFGCIITIQKIK